MEQKTKTRFNGRRLLTLVGILLVMGLCVVGFIFPAQTARKMPAISVAAERIPIHLPIPGFEEGIPNTLPTTALTTVILTLVALAYYLAQRRAARTGKEGTLLLLVDTAVEGIYSFVEGVTDRASVFFPLVASFFVFILTANWMGLLPGIGSVGVWETHAGETVLVPLFRSANADLSVTMALAIISVIAIQYFGFRFQGRLYLRKYINFTAPSDSPGALKPVLALANGFAGILELISDGIKIFSFAFRLFGNIFAGEVLLGVIGYLGTFIVTMPFIGLELFFGMIQALIFAMLSLVFFDMATHQH